MGKYIKYKKYYNRIIRASMVLLTLFVISFTYAWFIISQVVEVRTDQFAIAEAGGQHLEISADDGATWYSLISLDNPSISTFDISGDGFNLYYPTVFEDDNTPTAFVAAQSYTSANAPGYMEYNLKFRSASQMRVYLSEESYISPVDESERVRDLYGTFSKDYIAGCARASFIVNGAEGVPEELRFVWVPNDTYELVSIDETSWQCELLTDGEREAEYSYYSAVDNEGEITYIKNSYTNTDYALRKIFYGSPKATLTNDDAPVFFELNPQEGSFDEKSVTIRIWFEGTDREAQDAMAGGRIKIKLNFVGVSKNPPEAEKQSEVNSVFWNGSGIVGLKEGMLYSYDGINWISYDGTFTYNAAESQGEFFVKYGSTDEFYETAVNVISVI